MRTVLQKIAARRRDAVDTLKASQPLAELKRDVSLLGPPRFRESITSAGGPHVIAEIKKGSPSRGTLIRDFDPISIAKKYRAGGASALSVLTENEHFFGSFEHLRQAKEAARLPVLCKDFVIDEWQIYHAKSIGADAILLIVALHTKESLKSLLGHTRQARIDALVEVHSEKELDVALEAGAEIVGVNNRDLHDFTVSLDTAERLGPELPDECVKVAESGIFHRADVERLMASGFAAFLVGEALVTSEDPAAKIAELIGR